MTIAQSCQKTIRKMIVYMVKSRRQDCGFEDDLTHSFPLLLTKLCMWLDEVYLASKFIQWRERQYWVLGNDINRHLLISIDYLGLHNRYQAGTELVIHKKMYNEHLEHNDAEGSISISILIVFNSRLCISMTMFTHTARQCYLWIN